MNPKIIFTSEREPRAKTKPWPSIPCAFKGCDCSPVGCLEMQYYRKEVEEVIASAVPFKLDEDKRKITYLITKSNSIASMHEVELNKPYDVPEGLEIKFRGNWDADGIQRGYAFLKQQVKVETQDELWNDMLTIMSHYGVHYAKGQFKIERG